MDGAQQSFLISHKFLNKRKRDLSNSFLSKVLQHKNKRRCSIQCTSTQEKTSSKVKIMRSTTRFQIKKKACFERQRRRSVGAARNGIERKVRILKKLIPNGESKEMNALFEETADYILALQMRVKAMQIMVNLLSDSVNQD